MGVRSVTRTGIFGEKKKEMIVRLFYPIMTCFVKYFKPIINRIILVRFAIGEKYVECQGTSDYT